MAVELEVIGLNPPCPRCEIAIGRLQVAMEKLATEGITVNYTYRYGHAPETLQKYGQLMLPAIAVNGVIKIQGSIPTDEECEEWLRAGSK